MRRTPPFLTSACLLLWGVQSGWLIPAVAMAAVLAGSRFIKTRWVFSSAHIARTSDLCALLLVSVAAIALYQEPSRLVLSIVPWLPLVLYPLILVQQYSQSDRIDAAQLFLMVRRRKGRRRPKRLHVNLSYPYAIVCIVSAAGAGAANPWFFFSLIVLTAWALWPLRTQRYGVTAWIVILLVGGAVGYAGHRGLNRLQTHITDLAIAFFMEDNDPSMRTTAIGEVGRLKLSDRIQFRISPGGNARFPMLLRQACYTAYDRSTWYATHSGFDRLMPDNIAAASWQLDDEPETRSTIHVAMYIPRGKSLLNLPGGAFRLSRLDVATVERNPLGAVMVDAKAGLTNFTADYDPIQLHSRAPDETDLSIPNDETATIQQITAALNLPNRSEREVVAKIRSYFADHFTYSLDLVRHAPDKTDLAGFLRDTRSGHCEYFATATVLLLRAAGIPARYVSGFMAWEYSDLEKRVVVRHSHAHAWAMAYLSEGRADGRTAGRWVNIDTTPPDWTAIEAESASDLLMISDFFSYLRFKFSTWRQQVTKKAMIIYLAILLFVLLTIFLRRLAGAKSVRLVQHEGKKGSSKNTIPLRTTDFSKIEQWLNGKGLNKGPGETLYAWVNRLEKIAPATFDWNMIQPILALHYQHRYSADGLSSDGREKLSRAVEAVLEHNRRLTQKQ